MPTLRKSACARSVEEPAWNGGRDVVRSGAREMDAGVDVHRRVGRGHERLERRPDPARRRPMQRHRRGRANADRPASAPTSRPSRSAAHATARPTNAASPATATADRRQRERVRSARAGRRRRSRRRDPTTDAAKRIDARPSAARQHGCARDHEQRRETPRPQHEREISHSGTGARTRRRPSAVDLCPTPAATRRGSWRRPAYMASGTSRS